ncbi:MAG: protein kinase [Lachnoclostridium sp.]|nr:protein kinase [Lachnospira sp.]MCM1248815.1 protein kinase [Lachnoclostridium sp.]
MLGLDKAGADKLLLQLEARGLMDSGYRFSREKDGLLLLGRGSFSYVYEMYDIQNPERLYAAKIIGLGNKVVNEDFIVDTTRIQYFLSGQSENILRVIALWTMKLHLDEEGNVITISGSDVEDAEEEGVPLQIILMERLDSILSKDKYGNIKLLRDDLKTEEGIVKFAENIGRALLTVHNHSFLHRDVKLENIFWDKDLKQYKLGDFGIARYIGGSDAETVVFTDGYGAPEIERQITDFYNEAADIYSFGITLFLLLNNLKFPASDGYCPNMVQYSKDFIIPAPVNASEAMARIVRKMCSYRVQDRYQSVGEVLADIGKMGKGDGKQGFTEYDDVITETYRDEAAAAAETDRTPDEESIWEKDESELNREERKIRSQIYEEVYTEESIKRMCIAAVLFMLLFKSFSPQASYTASWQFLILPAALLVESILERMKEFYIEFKILVIGMTIFSAYTLGMDVPMAVIMLVVVLGVPAITAGCALGTGLWLAQMLTGKMAWLSFLSRWDLGWIVILGVAAVIESCVLLRDYYKKGTRGDFLWAWALDKIWCVMIPAGLILLLLEHFHVIVIPDIVKQIHLVRTGIGIFIMEMLYLEYYGLLEDTDCEDEELNEPVDEGRDCKNFNTAG